ncbi:DUF502 domain-containing protein [Lignipirellula cremea]|uniref:DUF502 domain-containing protein n=1 Tax=Lignipirellula cremea TaxID=2528010 RepID=A0A518DUA6_9BACT|nr:DUF502 domain-containing protein [Lignipirellula cremea]QDU95414.1 hypothetical protein Pla8534_32290 [Lignipirellula cremea]
MDETDPTPALRKHTHPFRRALLRGLGVVLPPLLTVVFFIWVWSVIETNVLTPMEDLSRQVVVWCLPAPLASRPADASGSGENEAFVWQDRVYVRLAGRKRWIPKQIRDTVDHSDHAETSFRAIDSPSASDYYWQYAKIQYLQRTLTIPIFLLVFLLSLYLVGKLLAAGVGRILWNYFERLINQLPIIRNVYSSVKQVTDFVFSESEVEFNRVVAVEYPRKGIWSIGFVTGESMLAIREAAQEPVLTILMPTSPMPATGFTITVLRGEAVDLDLTIDQAVQFIVSCGVVVPPHQQYSPELVRKEIAAAIAARERE